MEITNNLGKLRYKAGFSQEKLAEKLSVSRQTISKWENGETYPSTEHIFMLAEALGCSLRELVGAKLGNQLSDSSQTQEPISDTKQRPFYQKPLFWLTSLSTAIFVVLLGCGVAIANLSTQNATTTLETAQLEVFDEVADGFLDTALNSEGVKLANSKINKEIVGYGISEEDGSFYIKCNISTTDSTTPCSAIVYISEQDGSYTCRCQFLNDPEFRSAGEYHQIG